MTLEEKKNVSLTAVVSGLVSITFLGTFAWVGMQASYIPEIQTKLNLEVGHINTSLDILAKESAKTNKTLREYTKAYQDNYQVLSEDLVIAKYKIDFLERECNKNKKECREQIKEIEKRLK